MYDCVEGCATNRNYRKQPRSVSKGEDPPVFSHHSLMSNVINAAIRRLWDSANSAGKFMPEGACAQQPPALDWSILPMHTLFPSLSCPETSNNGNLPGTVVTWASFSSAKTHVCRSCASARTAWADH